MTTSTDPGYAYGYPYGTYQTPPPPPPYPVPAVRRRRSPLGIGTASAALVAFGSLLALDATDAVTVPGVVLAAVPLLIVGLGLLAAAVTGARAGGLIGLGVIILLVTAAAAHPPTTTVNGGTGDRTWTPATVAAAQAGFELGAGDARLDLTQVPLNGATVHVTANIGAGQLVVTVPADATVTVDAHAGLGRVAVPDGIAGPDEADGFGPQRTVTLAPAGPSAGTLDLDLQVGIGNVEVHRAYA